MVDLGMSNRIVRGLVGALLTAAALHLGGATAAFAEPQQIRISKQYGLGFLPLMIMQKEELFERRAAEQKIETKPEWITFGGPAASNEALLSGNADIIANGPPSFLIMWGRTQGTPLEVKGIAPLVALPMYLVTRNPKVKSIEDFTENDRIAVTSVKTSIPAIVLQMAAAKRWGQSEYGKLDPLTVSLPHPDALSALLSGRSEITSYFGSPPYQNLALQDSALHKVVSSNDIMGGPSTFTLMLTTKKFHDANPKAYAAFLAALEDAQKILREDKQKAADIYMELAKEGRVTRETVVQILSDPDITFDTTPRKIMQFAEFMTKVGTLKKAPGSWKETFFDDIHPLNGD